VGFNPDQPKILDIEWTHKSTVKWDEFRDRVQYVNKPEEVFDTTHPRPLLTIYFNRPDMRNIDRQTFQVSIEFPQMSVSQEGIGAFTGLYNAVPIRLYGYPLPVPPALLNTPHTGETAKSAWTFVPDVNFFKHPFSKNLISQFWAANNATMQSDRPLDLPCLHVVLKGDFIWAGPNFADKLMLDGNNIGGQVGVMPRTRDAIILGGKNPSGDLAEGGTFESWFFLSRPGTPTEPNGLSANPLFALLGVAPGTNINIASAEELRQLPGATDAMVRRILRQRESARFTGPDDFQQRVGLPGDVFTRWQGMIFFE
jgi:hypothetical protein